jgi:hypothetical protein
MIIILAWKGTTNSEDSVDSDKLRPLLFKEGSNWLVCIYHMHIHIMSECVQ